MYKQLISGVVVALAVPFASADSWDSDANLDRGVKATLQAHKQNGVDGLIAQTENCYAGLDTSRANRNVGKDVEYCVAVDIASMIVDGKKAQANGKDRTGYFSTENVFVRAGRTLDMSRQVQLPEQLQQYFLNRASRIKQRLDKAM